MGIRFATTLCAVLCCSAWGLASAGGVAAELPGDSLDQPPVSNRELAGQRARGGETVTIGDLNIQLNELGQHAKLDHNSVTSTITGDNSVSHDAFAGASGFATVIQNSGNNVIIQNATIVNYAVHP